MKREETREILKSRLTDYVRDITEPSKGANMYVCPLCGSGTGIHHTGAFGIYENGTKWKCQSCGQGGDLLDLIGAYEHIDGYTAQLNRAMEIFGITPGNENDTYLKGVKRMGKTQNKPTTEKDVETPETDYTDFFGKAQERLFDENDKRGMEYLNKRGISVEIAREFRLGFVPEWRCPSVPSSVPTSPRVTVPTSKYSYLARDIRSDLPADKKIYEKQKVGKVHIFNEQALYSSDKPIYVVEGEWDALSIIEVDGNAVALGSTSMIDKFLSLVGKKKPTQPIIVALDNDTAGKEHTPKLIKGLKKLGIEYFSYDPANSYKDANEALTEDRAAFTKAVEYGNDIKRNTYLKQFSAGSCIQKFKDSIEDSVNTPCIPTGFLYLDNYLGGGLYPGLYILGSIPSNGKTTLILQIGDHAAQCGTDVLIFSLEMSKFELMAKSVSRLTAMDELCIKGKVDAKSSLDIANLEKNRQYYKADDTALIDRAIESYSKFADRVFVVEGSGNISSEDVRREVERHIKLTGNVPLVIIDYLQILAPNEGYEQSSERIIADQTSTELRRVSRDFRTPVITVSSFNRANYNEKVNFSSFKESGGLEYAADVLIGLQLAGTKKGFDSTEAKDHDVRDMEIYILKNRNGRVGKKIKFSYRPEFNLFEEVEDNDKDDNSKDLFG